MKKVVLCSALSLVLGVVIGFASARLSDPPPANRAEVMKYLEGLDVAELADLTRSLEARWRVQAAPPAGRSR